MFGHSRPTFFIFTSIQYNCLKYYFLIAVYLVCCIPAAAQTPFSIVTDISVMRNFSPQQKFWALGQRVQGDFHFTTANALYASIQYHTKGSFRNTFMATADSLTTTPQSVSYTMEGSWRFRQVSIGWKRYWMGSSQNSNSSNLYSSLGFGLLFSKATNRLLTPVDTSLYQLAPSPVEGTDEFKRLTLDLALGMEQPVADYFYLFGEIRTSVPTSDYPSPLLHNQKKVPLPIILCFGLRLLFGTGE